jgi:hypothetical protein
MFDPNLILNVSFFGVERVLVTVDFCSQHLTIRLIQKIIAMQNDMLYF